MHASCWNYLWPSWPPYCGLFQSVHQSASLSLQLNVARFPNWPTQRWFGTTEVWRSTSVCRAITAGGEATPQFVATQGSGWKLRWHVSVRINGWGMQMFEIMGKQEKCIFCASHRNKATDHSAVRFQWKMSALESREIWGSHRSLQGKRTSFQFISFDFAQFYRHFPNILGDIHRKQRLPGLLSRQQEPVSELQGPSDGSLSEPASSHQLQHLGHSADRQIHSHHHHTHQFTRWVPAWSDCVPASPGCCC